MTLRLAELFESSQVLVGVYDAQDRLAHANAAFRQAWFIGDDEYPTWCEIMRRNFLERRGTVISTDDIDAWLLSTEVRRGKARYRAYETDLHDGRWLWMTETVQPDGWTLCVASDITSIRADERTLRQDRDQAIKAAQTDELTGIASRRYALSKLRELIASGGDGDGERGCLAVLDVDNFKYINDRFGHAAGDAVLRDFAATLQAMVRKTDILGRVGGEEFVLIMPGASTDAAAGIIQRMLDAIRQARPLPDQQSFRYTFSAGIARLQDGDSADEVYRRADLALYAAKMRGRDQISIDVQAQVLQRAT